MTIALANPRTAVIGRWPGKSSSGQAPDGRPDGVQPDVRRSAIEAVGTAPDRSASRRTSPCRPGNVALRRGVPRYAIDVSTASARRLRPTPGGRDLRLIVRRPNWRTVLPTATAVLTLPCTLAAHGRRPRFTSAGFAWCVTAFVASCFVLGGTFGVVAFSAPIAATESAIEDAASTGESTTVERPRVRVRRRRRWRRPRTTVARRWATRVASWTPSFIVPTSCVPRRGPPLLPA
jgi:hypothetical protein